MWRDLFDDGVEGVYKRISESGSVAVQTADMNDRDVNMGEITDTQWMT